MEGQSGVTSSISDELRSWDIQRGHIEGEGGVTRSIINELLSGDMAKWKVRVVLLEV